MNKKTIQFEYCFINEITIDEFIKSFDKIKFNRFVDQLSFKK